MNNVTGEIKSQTVFMGDFLLMTERGTFIINGTERVVVSQLVRSPGVYFEQTPDKTSDKDIFTAKVIPSRGALAGVRDRQARHGRRPRRPQAQAERHGPAQGPGWSSERILEEFGEVRVDAADLGEGPHPDQDEALLDIYRKMRPGEPRPRRPRRPARQPLLQRQALRPGQGRSLQR